MKEERAPFLLRLPAELKARIEDLAKREHRSINQQIEFLLERALADSNVKESSAVRTERRSEKGRSRPKR